MKSKFVEASHSLEGAGNWGKFMIARFTEEEWARRSAMPDAHGQRLLSGRGWALAHVMVFDLQTGEGAMFRPGGLASSDLNKHKIWVCPLFEPFLAWFYQWCRANPGTWWDDLPQIVALPDAEFSLFGFRRPGPPPERQSTEDTADATAA